MPESARTGSRDCLQGWTGWRRVCKVTLNSSSHEVDNLLESTHGSFVNTESVVLDPVSQRMQKRGMEGSMNDRPVLTVKQLADYLGVHASTIYRALKRG